MPTYVYECPVCHARREARTTVELRDELLVLCINTKCPTPDYTRMVRVPTSANFRVEGFNAKNGYAQ